MEKMGVLIKFVAKPGGRDKLAAPLLDAAAIARNEVGTLLWTVHTSPSEPEAVWVYEVYRDEAALKEHESSVPYAKAKEETGALLGGPPETFPMTPLGGKGLA